MIPVVWAWAYFLSVLAGRYGQNPVNAVFQFFHTEEVRCQLSSAVVMLHA